MTINNKFPKGSEWRRWDLHVHTKDTIKNDQFKSLDFEKFCITLFKKALENKIAVIGITDYFSIDNYKRVLAFIDNIGNQTNFTDEEKIQVKNILILPNVELRMMPSTNSGSLVNIHCIFNPKYVCSLDNDFFSSIEFLGGSGKKFKMNRQGMIELGKSLDDKINDEQAYKKGINNFVVSPTDLQRICDENINFRNNTIIVVSNSSNDGASSLQKHYTLFENDQESQLDAVRRSIYCLSQAIFSSNANDIKYFLGIKQGDDKETVRKKCGSLKPCIHGSDAHSEDALFSPNNNMYCWIKSNPTFEGLKQIIFEPEDRVYIGSQKPGTKKPYFVIDHVCFLDNSDNPKFGSEPIEINQNLTTITGGKSTGKSLLLYYMAKTINPQEVKSRTETDGALVKYDLDETQNFNFEVVWKDGQRTLLKPLENYIKIEYQKRKILYIPQRYLNTLSETNIKSREALNEFVLNVILQDHTINNKYQEIIKGTKSIVKSIASEIGDLFSDQDDIKKIEEELRQAGDEKGIEAYIQTLQKKSDDIKTQSGLSDEQIQQYKNLITQENEINTEKSNLQEDKKTINDLRSTLANQINSVRSIINEHETYLNDNTVKSQFNSEFKIIDTYSLSLESAISNLTTLIDEKSNNHETNLKKINAELAPLLAIVKLQSELQAITNTLKQEQQKLNEITIKKNNLKTKKASYSIKIKSIIESYRKIISQYESLQIEFKKFEDKFGDISLAVHVNFNGDNFNSEVINSFLNKKHLKKALPADERGEEFVYKYDQIKHLSNISTIFNGLLSGEINTIKNKNTKDAVIKLLEDYFYIDFRIFYKNDSLDKMSPGKKGLVLLQLLINLSNEEWPILLDQPEDDLDNRSVYDDLVHFLKEKKNKRQIIIVTHNPNLVVGADAEEIIVANQSGQDVGRENKKFRFEYVTGSLEDAFELDAKNEPAILLRKGIRQHVCEILEGGKEAFQKREKKYNFAHSHLESAL